VLGTPAALRYLEIMADASALPPKRDVALALLQGPSMLVHLDPRRDGVVVPKWFNSQPQLVLQVGLNMAVPIHDLDVGEDGLGCTLSFNRSPFWCFLPWTAVYALVGEDGRGMVWPDDIPPELARKSARPPLTVVDKSTESRSKAERTKIAKARPKSKGEQAKADSAAARLESGTTEAGRGGARRKTVPETRPKSVPVKPAPVSQSPARRSDEGGARKLPPYLRVIK
jgi:stringent starvation protein B